MKKMTSEILMGCDPELFITLDGKPRSAFGMIPGTKATPYSVEKGAVQVDGMALEFNIDPAKTEEEFVTNIQTVLRQLREMVDPKFKFCIKPSVRFNGNHMNKQPDEAKELGCEPDFNAYTLQENPRPNGDTTLRTASGHIHIGFTNGADPNDEAHRIKCATLCKHLDLFLGLRSVEWDTDITRFKLYGKPGALRFKPYGLEYRVLSNQWLESEALVRFVYRQVIDCIDDLMTNGALSTDDYQFISSDIVRRKQSYSRWNLTAKGAKAFSRATARRI